jgi:NAD(P)-dependent dehydrogenase (short-subunit alcohol dehydrogenase family)
MAGRLSGKVCIITGSGGSMGRAAAILFASEGARIIGCDVNVDSAIEMLRLVKAARGDMVSLQPCDLADAKQCQALVEFAVSTYGQIDVLFNNAAMAYFGWSESMLGKIMLGRAGRPEEIANAALFIASDESTYAIGADLLVDGGMTAW